jgi:hypothetical protein
VASIALVDFSAAFGTDVLQATGFITFTFNRDLGRTNMSRSRPKRARQSVTDRAHRRLGVFVAALAAVSILVVLTAGGTPLGAQTKQKKYKATRAIVVDQQTGEVRMPTQEEVNDVVANLTTLGQRPADTLQQTTVASGGVRLDLDGAFNGVVLARPNDDGVWETKCVFTLEEGAEFLGLVEDASAQ